MAAVEEEEVGEASIVEAEAEVLVVVAAKVKLRSPRKRISWT